MTGSRHIAVIHSAGKLRASADQINLRIQEIKEKNFEVSNLVMELESFDGVTAGPVLERAALLSQALTWRKFSVLWAARGGVGTTEMIPYLENMLPPIISRKTLVGFSDISYLGNYLAFKYANFRYIHAKNVFSDHLFEARNNEAEILFNLLKDEVKSSFFETHFIVRAHNSHDNQSQITGACFPINLSLLESFVATRNIHLTGPVILFVEECNEYLYRIIRKLDSAINSGFMQNCVAVVLGAFSNIKNANEEILPRAQLLEIIARKVSCPVYDLPIFGHDQLCFPLVARSTVIINHVNENKATIELTHVVPSLETAALCGELTSESARSYTNSSGKRIHFSGIGGTGMAQVAGLFKHNGYSVTGSDNPIYPPMDKVIKDLEIPLDVGFKSENISSKKIDAIVLANIIGRKNAALQKNMELEEILKNQMPIFSFPSALRKYFLHKSFNIVISGTHGKTTTSSLVTHLLTGLGYEPSFLIGGSPVNFGSGYALKSKDLFVLEGDEYDSAFFDKGPKFLHYEPSVTLLNNIEFDHADIYENVERIEEEFLRLAKLTRVKKGMLVANFDDARVQKICERSGAKVIGFGKNDCFSYAQSKANRISNNEQMYYKLLHVKTLTAGCEIEFLAPNGKTYKLFSQVFGEHNALNILASLASYHAYLILNQKDESLLDQNFSEISRIFKEFKGVKRRFELLNSKNDVTVFDDFAHHPTAIKTTLHAFREYMKSSKRNGRLIVCFDPRNATMRRNVLQNDLSKSFAYADVLFLGKVPIDMRMDQSTILSGEQVVKNCDIEGKYFDDNEKLFNELKKEVKPGDTIVFMSSGSFDGLPYRFSREI